MGSMLIVGVLAYYVMSQYWANAIIMSGTLFILYQFLTRLKSTLYDAAWLMNNMQERHRDIINSQYLSDHFSEIERHTERQISHIDKLVLKDLNFKYVVNTESKVDDSIKDEKVIFDLHINELHFEKGKSYAFVGESGCGKTTTMKILAALVELEGYSLVVNAERLRLENIRDTVMLIPQEPELFSNTIRENITLGLPFTESEVDEVLNMVNMKDTVDGLPEGRESKVFEKGVNLSGGQKQRLALARGVLFAKNKEMILLDEPTSSVDQENEERIYEALIKISQNKILISSVHKRNLLKFFDYVIHFEKGRVTDIKANK